MRNPTLSDKLPHPLLIDGHSDSIVYGISHFLPSRSIDHSVRTKMGNWGDLGVRNVNVRLEWFTLIWHSMKPFFTDFTVRTEVV